MLRPPRLLLCSLLLATFLCPCVRAQTPDTLPMVTGQLTTVSAYGSKAAAAPVATLSRQQLQRYDASSLLSGLNRVPGVRFEERATASYRVAIRGASLRAPFGVRNTQVYWNGIPYGDPGGDVPLNFLDASNIDEVQVIKGPSGGFYGPGTAGTLLLKTNSLIEHPHQADVNPTMVKVSLTAGSFGYARADLTLQSNKDHGTYNQFRAGYQRTDGYRDHSAMERLTVQYSATLRNKKYGPLTQFHGLYTKLDYELPGGLTRAQYDDNPRQARPGSADKNASIHYHNLLLGVTDERYLGDWKMETSGYVTGFYFDHPFNFDYKREANLGGGFRSTFRRALLPGLDVDLGAESRFQYRTGQNFTNPDGTRPGDLNFSDEIFSQEQLLFGQVNYTPRGGKLQLAAGLSNSRLDYAIDRTFSVDGEAGETNFAASRPLSLRLAASYHLGLSGEVFASRADGFSPPTLDEFRTNEGSLNTDLDAEVGTNYEIGYRYDKGKLRLSANAFLFLLDEAITSFTDERGTQLFRNAGRTDQTGVELMADYAFTTLADSKVATRVYATYTFFDFFYDDFQQRGTDFSGNAIPGAAPHTLNLELDLRHQSGLRLQLFHNFTDAIPLNDANDVFADAFHLLRARLAYERNGYTVFVTGSNLLDERMSFGNDLNPRFGGRYFQPAPGRNWQVGVRKGW